TGTDSMSGGTGTDSMSGGTGTDSMSGGTGTDSMSGSDTMTGGSDTMKGGMYYIYNFDAEKDVIRAADFGYGDSDELLDSITKSGQAQNGKYYSILELNDDYKVTIFSNDKLTADNCLVGTGDLPSSRMSKKIAEGDTLSIGKIKGLPPGLQMQLDKGMRSPSDLPAPFAPEEPAPLSGAGTTPGAMGGMTPMM
ncbi:hypothetical protein, partial [Argonema galeatum]|uniref:hypothetical protein n=1 Tax=Argonema galeatum TaxID=2942762 RepID=UPI0020113DBB